MTESTSDDDDETNASATVIFSSCAILFGLRKGVILCGFKDRKYGIYCSFGV